MEMARDSWSIAYGGSLAGCFAAALYGLLCHLFRFWRRCGLGPPLCDTTGATAFIVCRTAAADFCRRSAGSAPTHRLGRRICVDCLAGGIDYAVAEPGSHTAGQGLSQWRDCQ